MEVEVATVAVEAVAVVEEEVFLGPDEVLEEVDLGWDSAVASGRGSVLVAITVVGTAPLRPGYVFALF